MYVSRGRDPFSQRHPGLWGRDWSKNGSKHSRSINLLKLRPKSNLAFEREGEGKKGARPLARGEGGRVACVAWRFWLLSNKIPPCYAG